MSQEHYSPKTNESAILEELPGAEDTAATVKKNTASRAHRKNPVILRLTRRAVIFFGLETLALILFYISGNVQHFLERNIQIILWTMTVSTLTLALFCLAGIAESIYYFFSWKRPRFLLRIIPYTLILVIALLLTFFSRSVDLLSLGFTV